jgi:hypothetical protein
MFVALSGPSCVSGPDGKVNRQPHGWLGHKVSHFQLFFVSNRAS